MCGRACLTTAGYKGSLWCQPESSHLRQSGFNGVMLHFLNHTIKAGSGGRERERETFLLVVQGAKREGERGIAVIYVVVLKKEGVPDR